MKCFAPRSIAALMLAAAAWAAPAVADVPPPSIPPIPNPDLPDGTEGGAPDCGTSDILGSGIISDICWDCILPIQVSGIEIFSGTNPVPADAADDVICLCDGPGGIRLGTTFGMWMPTHIYETTYKAGCSPTLGGVTIAIADRRYGGSEGHIEYDMQMESFNHVHVYSFPALWLLELFTTCNTGYLDIEILFMTEIDPTWNDAVLAMYTNPFAVFAANLVSLAACVPDAISSSVGFPIDELFWCAGTWDTAIPPLMGVETNMMPVQFTSMSSLKTLVNAHLRGYQRSTVGDAAACYPRVDPIMNKSHYRWQVIEARPEAESNHATGESLFTWGSSRTIPGVLDLPIYLLWQWVDCCGSPAF